jgi:YVTN family beta-propeller protein
MASASTGDLGFSINELPPTGTCGGHGAPTDFIKTNFGPLAPREGEERCYAHADPRGPIPQNSSAVNATIDLANGTLTGGAFPATSDTTIGPAVSVTRQNLVYVGAYRGTGCADGADLLALNASSLDLASRLNLTATGCPQAFAFDPGTFRLYVAFSSSLVVVNLTTKQIVTTIDLPGGAMSEAFDGSYRQLYATGGNSGNITVINVSSNSVADSIPSSGAGLTYDPASQDIVVGEGDALAILNTTENRITSHVSVANGSAEDILYDPLDGNLYAAGWKSDLLSILNATTERVTGSITLSNPSWGLTLDGRRNVLYAPDALNSSLCVVNLTSRSVGVNLGANAALGGVYDPAADTVLIAAWSQLLVFNGSSSVLSKTIVLATEPATMLYDPANGDLYVTDLANDWVWVIDSTDDAVVAHISVGAWPWAASLDSASGRLYVANEASWTISVIDTGTNRVLATWGCGYTPGSLAIDDTNNTLFEGNAAYTDDIWVYNLTTGAPVGHIGVNATATSLLYDPLNDNLYVGSNLAEIAVYNASSYLPVASVPFGVESAQYYDSALGLALDMKDDQVFFLGMAQNESAVWQIDGPSNRLVASLPLNQSVGRGADCLDELNGRLLVLTGGNELFWVNDSSLSVEAESTLPGSPIDVAVGTGSGTAYVSDWVHGTIYVLAPNPVHPFDYNVTFRESGLPLGTSWSVLLDGGAMIGTSSSLSFGVASGTYPFSIGLLPGYRATPSTGVVTVSNGDPSPIVIVFTSTSVFGIVFEEVGLPAGMGWSVAMGGYVESGVARDLTIFEPNGTYAFEIQTSPGFTTSFFGAVTVAGANVSVAIVFALLTFPVLIEELGLPAGANWAASVAPLGNNSNQGPLEQSGSGSSFTFHLANGSYGLTVSGPPGYSVNLATAILTVAGPAAQGLTVRFSSVNSIQGAHPGPPIPDSSFFWYAGVAAAASGLTGLGLAVRFLRHRRPPSG